MTQNSTDTGMADMTITPAVLSGTLADDCGRLSSVEGKSKLVLYFYPCQEAQTVIVRL